MKVKKTFLNCTVTIVVVTFSFLLSEATAGTCIRAGSTDSEPASVQVSSGIAITTGNAPACSAQQSLEARFRTWLFSNPIGIDPTLVPGFLLFVR